MEKPILVVTAGGRNPQILINALAERFADVSVLEEQPESKKLFLKRRAKKLGYITAAGQFATMAVSKFGKRFTEKRAEEIVRHYGVNDTPNASLRVTRIDSINSPEALSHIARLRPAAIFLVSCRMLTPATLAAITCPVINFHAGINPQYRGLMGGYWARVRNDLDNFGSTVHLVDTGVDTGGILYQQRITPAKNDSMHTYPLLQTAAATGIAIRAVEDALTGRLMPQTSDAPSQQWYHPPIWTWAWNGLTRGIW